MSTLIEIPVRRSPQVREIVAQLGDDLRTVPELPERGAWPQEPVVLYRAGISARYVEVTWDGALRVKINVLSAPEDVELALDLTARFADRGGAPHIDVEILGDFPGMPQLRSVMDAGWVANQIDSGARAVKAMIESGRGPIQIPGPVRNCHIGERVLAELLEAGPDAELGQRMLDLVRRVRWVGRDTHEQAGRFIAEKDEEEFSFASWLPDRAVIFPVVDQLLVRVGDDESEIMMIPYSAAPEIAGADWEWIDEAQGMIRAYTGEEWTALVDRARPYRTDRTVH